MTSSQFKSGWDILIAAFDAKRSEDNFKEVYRNISNYPGDLWLKVAQEIIDNDEIFPKIARIKSVFAQLRNQKESNAFKSSPVVDKPNPASLILLRGIGEIFRMNATIEEKKKLLKELPGKAIREAGADDGEIVFDPFDEKMNFSV